MTLPHLLTIPPEHAGKRLDQSLAELLPSYSRSRLQSWIESGHILLAGAVASQKQKVWGGEQVQVTPEAAPEETAYQAEDIGLNIVYEDDAILVIDKPAGLVTHPGAGNWQGTLLNALLHYLPAAAAIPRAGIVHRLDKDTSGLMVVAKTLEAQTQLVRDLQARTVKRIYWAVALGVFARAEGSVDAAIGRHPTQRVKMAVHDKDSSVSKPALTYWKVLKQYPRAAWVECRLATGRTHQIRVHLTHLGHPLLGDPVYRGKNQNPPGLPPFQRQALHAVRLGLKHPVTGEEMEWEAPPPQDFADLIAALENPDAS
ncbi:MAG: 23S rRNA pseudouridine(1911/1915/1917) synthase [Hydrogenophilales bacterium 28-61-23]|nr:MAG: 23S rRNA pseudouridine(1911/1915/1917) synthase [Hydrogenophilales bacterium 28-61-23]